MTPGDLAYLAGVIDSQAVIRSRQVGDTVLPMVALHGSNMSMLDHLAAVTGTKVTPTSRTYDKAGCSEHCPDKHQHIVSKSGRWSVTGARATVLLAALRPFLRLQGFAADEALAVGLRAPRKGNTAGKMAGLGWPLPDGWEATREDTP